MHQKLIGPFSQIVTMDHLPKKGRISDASLEIIEHGGILTENEKIQSVGLFRDLFTPNIDVIEISEPSVALPGFIDAHTHLCFAGSREIDYAKRVSGITYREIAAQGGGILDTVKKTRKTSQIELVNLMRPRLKRLLQLGVTTCEIKSGYGLSVQEEMKMLRAIREVSTQQPIDLIPTCLAAHVTPWEFSTGEKYLRHIARTLFPLLKSQHLSKRVDIFVDEGAFSVKEAKAYLLSAQKNGFSVCIHANQFSEGGAALAAEIHATSADHLEHLSARECQKLIDANVVTVVLPGASLGLGLRMAPARMMLDSGAAVAIASDWNPGSAPMGHLLVQAAIMGALEKLTMAETLAAITVRASHALELKDRGVLKSGRRADFVSFPCRQYQEILYHQGTLLPTRVFVQGEVSQITEV